MAMVKCPYCKQSFEKNKIESVYRSRRYYHIECMKKVLKDEGKTEEEIKDFIEKNLYKPEKPKAEVKEKKTPKKSIKICRFCGKPLDITTEPYKMIANRYAHSKCYDENINGEEGFVEKIYELLKSLNINYDFQACERQRAKYNTQGISNEDIFKTLRYTYITKKVSPAGAGGRIGIVPYMVEEARNYYRNLEKIKSELSKDYKKNKSEVKVIHVKEREKEKKKDYINIDNLT